MPATLIADLISAATVTNREIRRAAVHLPKSLRQSLFSETSPEHRSAVGKFYESLVYELLLTCGESSPAIIHIAAKYQDAEYREFDRFTRDGLWYSKDGEILFRIGGKVTAEVDFLILCSDNTLIFGEVTINPETLPELLEEAIAKKRFLEELCQRENLPYTVEFILVTPENQPENTPNNGYAYAVIPCISDIRSRIHPNEILHKKRSPAPSSKRINGITLFSR